MKNKQQKITELVQKIPFLTDGQVFWLDKILTIFQGPHTFQILQSDLIDNNALDNLGDALRIHHSFSAEPFSKDKFEYVLETVLKMSGHQAQLAPKGNRGHDITVDGKRISLKTQANKTIQKKKIWISKFMELGKGIWGDNPDDLIGLRDFFFEHLNGYDRIFTLRSFHRSQQWYYELVEIPKDLLLEARNGELEMKLDSIQFPKPGYCYVRSEDGTDKYQLYFDAGSERKLQVKNLQINCCIVHATWDFTIPQEKDLFAQP